jgi:hypothetical protein
LIGKKRLDSRFRAYVIYHKDFPVFPESDGVTVFAKNGFVPPPNIKSVVIPSPYNTQNSLDRLEIMLGEFAAHFWIWRNVTDLDFVGIMHYRRYFLLNPKHPLYFKDKLFSEPVESSVKYLTSYENLNWVSWHLKYADIITPRIVTLGMSISDQYCQYHCKEDWDIFCSCLPLLDKKYAGAINWLNASNKIFFASPLLVTHWSTYQEIMSACNELVNIMYPYMTLREGYQERSLGFILERFLSVFFWVNGSRLSQVPIVALEKSA